MNERPRAAYGGWVRRYAPDRDEGGTRMRVLWQFTPYPKRGGRTYLHVLPYSRAARGEEMTLTKAERLAAAQMEVEEAFDELLDALSEYSVRYVKVSNIEAEPEEKGT
jgi:hypothetical protein